MPTHEAARRLGMTRLKVRYLVGAGRLGAVKRGLYLYFDPREVEAFAARREAAA